MAATLTLYAITGASPTYTNIGGLITFCTADEASPGTEHTIPYPTSGTKRSYWKNLTLYITGSFTQVKNIRLFTSGASWTGITIYCGNETLAIASYQQATGVEDDSGNEVVTTHDHITAKTDLFTYTYTTPKTVDSTIYTTTGYSKHVVLQMDVDSTVTLGALSSKVITWIYDEI